MPDTGWTRPGSADLPALLLLFALLLLARTPPTAARQINYFDVEQQRLPMGDPPGLDPPPGPGSGWRENSDVAGLSNSANAFQHWDAAVLRTFYRPGATTQRTFLALVAADGGNGTTRTEYLDLGDGYLEFNRPHMAAGDFNGDGYSDLAIGIWGGVDVVYLQDSADAPFAYRRRIDHTDVDLGLPGGYIPYTGPETPYTVWPLKLLTLPDMDGDGVDELWLTARFYQSLDGDFTPNGAQIAWMVDPGPGEEAMNPQSGRMSFKAISPIRQGRYPPSTRTRKGYGSVVARIGDVDGNGINDLMVEAGRNCDGIDFAVIRLQADYEDPVKDFYPVMLDESASYWLRGCREEQGPPVEIGFGTSTAVRVRVSPILSPLSFFLAIRKIGDLTGNGHPEVLVQYVARAPPPRGNLEKNLILSPIYSNFSHMQLAGFLEPPVTFLTGFSLWDMQQYQDKKQQQQRPTAGSSKALTATPNMAYAFRTHPDRGTDHWVLEALQMPLPMTGKVPVRMAEEPELLVFKQPGYDLSQALNIMLAGLGFVCALLVLARLDRARPRAAGLASLLNYTERWLFISNALYAGCFLAYAVATNVYTRRHGLIRSYALNEFDADPRFALLERWIKANDQATLWLQHLSLLPAFWHIGLAWVFYKFLVRGRSPAVLERQVRGRVWWLIALIFVVATTAQAVVFFHRGGLYGPNHLIQHLVNNVVCFVVVTFLYVRTVAAWVRRYGFHLTGQQRRLRRRSSEGSVTSFGGVQHRQAKALWRLMAILLVFDATWLVVLINDIAAVREGQHRGSANAGMGDAPSTFMTVADAIILGNVVSLCWRCRAWFGPSPTLAGTRGQQERGGAKGASIGRGRRASMASVSHRTAEGALRPHSRHDLSLRLFISTYNAGSAGKSTAALGSLEAWIPLGFDLYVIGLQECNSALLDDLKRAVHALLGGPQEYALHLNHVWSSNGEIALLLLARARDVASGAFEILGGLFNRVHLGVSVGVGRLPNKAAVGLACRLHDRTLACVTAHFAADKHGRERPEARVRDAVRSLKELSLGLESEEVDLQLAFHHTVILGDLNFRVRLPPERVVSRLAASIAAERRALSRLIPAQPMLRGHGHGTSSGGGDPGSSSGSSWLARGRSALVGHPYPSRRSAPVSSTAGSEPGRLGTVSLPSMPRATQQPNINWEEEPGAGNGSYRNNSLATAWRLARHQEALPALPAPGPFGTHSRLLVLPATPHTSAAASGVGRAEEPTRQQEAKAAAMVEAGGIELQSKGRDVDSELGSASPQHQQGAGGRRRVGFGGGGGDEEDGWHADYEGGSGSEAEDGDDGSWAEDEEQDDEEGDGEEARPAGSTASSSSGGASSSSGFSSSTSGSGYRELLDGWDWAREHDECSRVMREGKALHGFTEGHLCFPPSFRWIKGARADYSKEGVAAFEGCYTLRKKGEGSKGLRPPSYTDRVLVHSLPDLVGDVRIDDYDCCEAISGSDHRPVAAALRLATSREAAAAADANARAAAAAMNSAPLRPEHEVKVTLSAPAYLPRRAAVRSRLKELGRSVVPALGGGGGLFASEDYLTEMCEALVVHYPLAMEQPAALAAQRRALEMEEGMLGGAGNEDGEDARGVVMGQAQSAQGVAAAGGGGGGSEVAASAAVAGWKHQRTVHEWRLEGHGGNGGGKVDREASGGFVGSVVRRLSGAASASANHSQPGDGAGEGAFSLRVSVVGLPLYAVVRLKGRGPGAKEVGQGNLCFREILQEQRRLDALAEAAPEKGVGGEGVSEGGALSEGGGAERPRPPVLAHVDITHGGKLVGSLQVRVRVSVRRIPGAVPEAPVAEAVEKDKC